MAYFGSRSTKELITCNQDIQDVLNEVIKYIDCAVLKGHRGEEEQNKAYNEGKSQLRFPLSNHNADPSNAVDVVPFPINWKNISKFHELAGVIRTVCQQRGIVLEWGGDWETLKDFPHWESVQKEIANG